jgi:hypothetical protein
MAGPPVLPSESTIPMHTTATFARTLPPAPWRRTLVHGFAIAALAVTTQARAGANRLRPAALSVHASASYWAGP